MRRGGDEALRNFKIEEPEDKKKKRPSIVQGFKSVFASGEIQDDGNELLTVSDIIPSKPPPSDDEPPADTEAAPDNVSLVVNDDNTV